MLILTVSKSTTIRIVAVMANISQVLVMTTMLAKIGNY